MLWKKESKKRDAFYVNLLPEGLDHWESKIRLILPQLERDSYCERKSNAIALQKRNEGNLAFRAQKWLDALNLYGDSLRYAESNSEHIGLAYANRSACFLKLKMYVNCLKDIELAKAAGYREDLMSKLVERKANCLKQMQDDPQIERTPSINEPNDQFPGLANMAEVRKDMNGSYTVVAKSDIDIGQLIVAEEQLYKFQLGDFGSMCNICLKKYGNLVPCNKCLNAMFCRGCQRDVLHAHECGLNFCSDKHLNGIIMKAVRFILQTVKVFSVVNDLMAFIERCHENSTEWPANLMNEQTKYQSFFGHFNHDPELIDENVQLSVYNVYKTLMRIPLIHSMFKSTKYQRFLFHFIAHCVCREYSKNATIAVFAEMDSYFKHSCNPNVNRTNIHGKAIYYSIKPIKRGEQLCVTRIPTYIYSKEERQMALWDAGLQKCECPRCNGKEASPAQRLQITSDPMFVNIAMNKLKSMEYNDASSIMKNCVSFLRTYGHMDWCEEINIITDWLEILLDVHLRHDFNHPLAKARLQDTIN